MKRLLSILLSLMMLASMCSFSVAAVDGTVEHITTGLRIVNGPAKISTVRGNILNSANDEAVNFGNLKTEDGITNIWFAVDLGETKNVSEVTVGFGTTNIKKVSAYLTNSDTIWDEVYDESLSENKETNYAASLKAETIALLDADSAKIETVETGWTERQTAGAGETFDVSFSLDTERDGRYVFVVVEEAIYSYYGITAKHISVVGSAATSEEPGNTPGGDNTDDDTTVYEYMNEDVKVHVGPVAYSGISKDDIKTLDYTKPVNIGNITTNASAANRTVVGNAWMAFDLGQTREISGVDVYFGTSNAKSFSVYVTNSDSIWAEIETDGVVNPDVYCKALSQKGKCIKDVANVDNTEGTTPGSDVILTSDGIIDRLVADGALMGTVETGWTERASATANDTFKKEVSFSETKEGRYVFVVVWDDVIEYFGINVNHVSVYGPEDPNEDPGENPGGDPVDPGEEPDDPGETPVVPPADGEYSDEAENLMSEDVGIKAFRDYQLDTIYTLEGPEGGADTYATFGNFGSNANVWIAFDLGQTADVEGIDFYMPKKNTKDYLVYATKSSSVYDGLGSGASIPADMLTSWNNQNMLVAEGTMVPVGEGNTLVSSIEESKERIVFPDGPVEARYIIFVVTSVEKTYFGSILDYVEFYGVSKESTGDDEEDDEGIVIDVNTANKVNADGAGNRYFNSATDLLRGVTAGTELELLTDGKLTTGLAVTQGQTFVIDMQKEQVVNRIELVQNRDKIKKYSIYYSADNENWTKFCDGDYSNVEYTAFEKGHPINLSNYGDTMICRYIKVVVTECDDNAMLYAVEAYNTESGAEVNFANGDARKEVLGVKTSTNTLATMGKSEYIYSPSKNNPDEHFVKTHVLSAVDSTLIAVDMGAVSTFDRIQITYQQNEVTKYRLYACNDNSMWTTILGFEGKGTPQITEAEASRMVLLAEGTRTPSTMSHSVPSNPDYLTGKRNQVQVIEFDEGKRARYLVFAIDETAYKYWSAGILEFEVFKNPVDELIHTPSDEDPVFAPVGENYALGADIEIEKEYISENVRFTDSAVLTDGVKSDGKNKFYLGGATPVEMVVDLGAPKPMDRLIIYEYGKRIKDFTVYSSVDNINWELRGNYENTPDATRAAIYTEAAFDFTVARYIKIVVNDIEDIAILSEIEAYCSQEGAEIVNLLTADLITDEDMLVVTEELIDLPTSIADDTYSATITWSSNDEVVNAQTKQVTRYDVDKNVILTAHFTVTGGGIETSENFDMKFPVTVKADKVKSLVQTNTVANSDFADGVYTYSHVNDFYVKDNFVIELALEDIGTDTVTVDLTNTEITISKSEENTVIALGGEEIYSGVLPENVKFKFEFVDSTLNVYVDKLNTHRYRAILFGKALEGCTFKEIRKSDAAEVSASAIISIPANKVVDAVWEQFDFAKISNDDIFTVSNDLSLINEVFDVAVSYRTTDETAINGVSGAVDDTKVGVYTITATLRYGANNTKDKSFYVAVGNKFSGKPVTSTAVATSGASLTAITETTNTNEFITQKNAYDVVIDGQTEQAISQIVLVEPDAWVGAVKSFEIFVAGADEVYKSVATGNEINGEYIANFNPTKVQFIKVTVKTTGGKNGFAKIFGFYKPSDSGCVASDLAAITLPEEVSADFNLPKSGEYGSTYTYSSSNGAIVVTDNSTNYIMDVVTPENDISVKITVTATKNAATVSKTISLRVQGNRETSGTFPDDDLSAGSTGSTGGNGGGGGGGGDTETTKPPVAEKPAEEPVPVTPVSPVEKYAHEIENHWAKTEITALLEKGIVNGDGNSLNLSASVTRAEFLAMILRSGAFELKEYNDAFKDVSVNDWYAKYMQTGFDAGIISGDGVNANPNNAITRQEAALMLSKLFADVEIKDVEFADGDYISPWAKDGVMKAAVIGLIKGYEDGKFMPHKNIRRDEAMVVIYRYMMISEEEAK